MYSTPRSEEKDPTKTWRQIKNLQLFPLLEVFYYVPYQVRMYFS